MEEKKLKELAVSLGTPAYVFDTDVLEARAEHVAEKLRPAKLCFAIKANPFLVEAMDSHVERYEVCSPGEFHICVERGTDRGKILLSGVNKEYKDVRYAMEQGVRHYTAESVGQYRLVARCAKELGKQADILLRITNGNQFGMSESDALGLIRGREESPGLVIVGIQYYTGTQKKALKKIAAEAAYIEGFLCRLKEEEGFCAQVLEFGPGLGVPYFTKDDFGEDEKILEGLSEIFREERPYQVVFEMGRYLTASCGYYLTRIMDQKENDAVNVCIVDGGIHHVSYYGQNMAMRTPLISFFPEHPIEEAEPKEWTVYGSLCTTADILLKKLPLLDARVGDHLAFHNTGAYSVTEGGYLFLSRDLPKIYLYNRQSGARLVRDGWGTWRWNTED